MVCQLLAAAESVWITLHLWFLFFLRSVRLQLRGPVRETGSMHDI